jgi:RNA-directed DNA polymerase
MKRIGNLYPLIYDIDNLVLADEKARKNKTKKKGVLLHDINRDNNILILHDDLKNKTYKTSDYTIFSVFEPKERKIYRLPYYPDRIVHHAIMNILEPIFVRTFTKDTYNCIKKRGIHGALKGVKKALRDREGTQYCLKIDIKKFYPSIDHEVLKSLLRRKFKDKDLLWLLDEIIDSTDGVPIGNYLSQYFANFYLTYFDHWLKEEIGLNYYFRYCDDLVILHSSKKFLHKLLVDIKSKLGELKLELKDNSQIFPVSSRGIDFVGYVIYHDYILLRKGIKLNFIKMVKYYPNSKSWASYYGWMTHCNSINLMNKYLNYDKINQDQESRVPATV